MKRYPSEILATCPIPWTSSYIFDEETFRKAICLLRDHLTRRVYLFGTAGEGYAVRDSQFREIVRVFRSEMDGPDDKPMVGTICLSLSTIIDRIEFCLSLGIFDFQISLPCWGALNDREVDVFFKETCGRFENCRFLHYNLARSNRVLTGNDYARLATTHPNLVAVKFGGRDQNARLEMLQKAPEIQYYFTELGFASIRDKHECGFLVSLAAVNFPRAKQFFQARGPELLQLTRELQGVEEALRQAVGEGVHMDGVYDKLILKANLPAFPLRLLPPYASVEDSVVATLLEQLPVTWRPPYL